MIITEQWSHWYPVDNLCSKFYINSIFDQPGKLNFLLCADDAFDKNAQEPRQRKLRIIFQAFIVFYKYVDEYCSIEDCLDLKIKYGKEFVYKTSFFKVANSKYLQLLAEESGIASQELQLTHFVILDFNSRVDIITSQEPLVEWIQHAD